MSLNGAGNAVRYTEVYNAPHTGVFISGNNHEVAGCDIHDVVQVRFTKRKARKCESLECWVCEWRFCRAYMHFVAFSSAHTQQWAGDSGAIYSGRDTTYRGNRVVNNTFRNLISCAGEVYALCTFQFVRCVACFSGFSQPPARPLTR